MVTDALFTCFLSVDSQQQSRICTRCASALRLAILIQFFISVDCFRLFTFALFFKVCAFFTILTANRRNKQEAQRLKASNDWLLEGMQALAEGDFANAETAIQKAHDLVQNADHEKLMAALAEEKNKQGFLFK